MRRLVPICLLIVLSGLNALAQNSQDSNPRSLLTATNISAGFAQDDPLAKKLEQVTDRLTIAEEKNRLLEDRLKAKDTTILNLEGVIQVRDQQLALAKSANQDRAKVNTGDDVMLRACEQQLSRADSEIARLRNPGFFKSVFDTRTFTGAIVGFGIGRATANK